MSRAPVARDLMTPLSGGVAAGSSLVETAKHLVQAKVAAAPVVTDGGSFVGIVTNREIVEQIAWDRDPHATVASEAAKGRAAVQAGASLDAVAAALKDQPDGRLPVIDGERLVDSDEDPALVRIDREYDLIWCGSLFTHLDAPRWPGFLALLESALSPGGLLVFTTHGRRDDRVLRILGLSNVQAGALLFDLDRTGFGYVAYEGQANWGLALALPEWVRSQIAECTSLRVIGYDDHAWDAPRPYQDAFWCVRPPA